jgi:hypothetical protein
VGYGISDVWVIYEKDEEVNVLRVAMFALTKTE